MKKERNRSEKNRLIVVGVVALLTCLSLLLYCSSMTQIVSTQTSLLIISGIGISATIFVFVFLRLMNDSVRENNKLEHFEKSLSLSNDFSKVVFRFADESPLARIIPNDQLMCMAKIDDDGTIQYTIKVDIKANTSDYEWFFENFNNS